MTQLVGVGLFPLFAGACTGVVKCKQRKQFYFLSLLQTDQIVAVEAEYVMSVRLTLIHLATHRRKFSLLAPSEMSIKHSLIHSSYRPYARQAGRFVY